MNESLFAVHSLFLVGVVTLALKFGKQALVITFCLLALLANLFVTKQIEFFYWTVTCSDAYEIGCFLSLCYIQTYFGEKLATKAVWLCFFTLGLFSLVSILHLAYIPSEHDVMHESYKNILSSSPRIMLSSILVCFFSQKLCLKLQSYAKKLKTIPQTLSIFLAIAISQAIDTLSFSFLGLYGLMHNLLHIMLISYMIKILCLACMSPVIKLSQKYLKVPQESI